MEIKNLSETKIDAIVECLVESFKNYFVMMPSDIEFWRNRFQAARVDFSLSFGVFDNGKLIAFIVHGIDDHNHHKTAFNTGTGVIENYRGLKLIDKLYAFAFPILIKNDVEKCMLEVIDKNDRAVAVYERIGFKKDRYLHCFKGEIQDPKMDVIVQEVNIIKEQFLINKYQMHYSWDNSIDAVMKRPDMFNAYLVKSKNESLIGYFIVNINHQVLVQLEAFDAKNWIKALGAVRSIIPSFKFNNIDSRRNSLINALKSVGSHNHINQFEMSMMIQPYSN